VFIVVVLLSTQSGQF